jgi:hypothetical protein
VARPRNRRGRGAGTPCTICLISKNLLARGEGEESSDDEEGEEEDSSDEEEEESEEEESSENDESKEGGTGDGQHRGAKRTAEDAELADADSSEGELGADYNGPGSSPLSMSSDT